MTRFRYRTRALRGPWRETAAEAEDDAVRAHQAVRNGPAATGLRWRVDGHIESAADRIGKEASTILDGGASIRDGNDTDRC